MGVEPRRSFSGSCKSDTGLRPRDSAKESSPEKPLKINNQIKQSAPKCPNNTRPIPQRNIHGKNFINIGVTL
jgi:hypothetical protein